MAKIKTTQNTASVEAFVRSAPSEETRQDCAALIEVMSEITRCEAKMWGGSIVGFDKVHYKYADGRPGEICLIGFSPRKQNWSSTSPKITSETLTCWQDWENQDGEGMHLHEPTFRLTHGWRRPGFLLCAP